MGHAVDRNGSDMSSQRTIVTAQIVTALGGISVANGYETNIGQLVFVRTNITNELEAPCAIVNPGTDSSAPSAGTLGNITIRYSIAGYMDRLEQIIPTAEYAIVDAIMSDIRDAIESAPCLLNGAAESIVYAGATPIYHEAAGKMLGASVSYLITTPYREAQI